MTCFELPHRHSDQRHTQVLYTELSQAPKFDEAAKFFKLLSDPTRLRIFWLLSHGEECVINIAALLDLSSPAISHHLRALMDGGLITSRRNGKEVFYCSADTESAQLVHKMLEQVMDMTCPENRTASEAAPEEIVRSVHTYLMEHLNERITIEVLSKRFLINTTTLKQAFKMVYGTSLGAHMKVHRMEKAAKLLCETNSRVALIAKTVGYESQSRFTTAFKEIYGILPTEYRKQYHCQVPRDAVQLYHNSEG